MTKPWLPVLILLVVLTFPFSSSATDPLPSWNHGTSKQSIIDLVTHVEVRNGKPVIINLFISHHPIFAFGSSDGNSQIGHLDQPLGSLKKCLGRG